MAAMSRATRPPKEDNFNFRVSADLKAAFRAAAESQDRPAAQIIREFMRDFGASSLNRVMTPGSARRCRSRSTIPARPSRTIRS
jgi:hypothetical protein